MTKEEIDKYKELEFVVEKLVDYCNNTVGMATACELIAVEAALERLYKARQKESEKDMTNVINNGGPAFPSGNEVTLGDWRSSGHSGMNLRDYFAAKAMQAIISSDRYGGIIGVNKYQDRTASNAYEMADAMLKARQVKND